MHLTILTAARPLFPTLVPVLYGRVLSSRDVSPLRFLHCVCTGLKTQVNLFGLVLHRRIDTNEHRTGWSVRGCTRSGDK